MEPFFNNLKRRRYEYSGPYDKNSMNGIAHESPINLQRKAHQTGAAKLPRGSRLAGMSRRKLKPTMCCSFFYIYKTFHSSYARNTRLVIIKKIRDWFNILEKLIEHFEKTYSKF